MARATPEKKVDHVLQQGTFGHRWHEASAQAQRCVVRSTLHVLRGKWKLLILSLLLDGPRRYGELRAALPEVTEKMLIQHLKELEQDQLVVRTSYPEVPPRVVYTLTDHGRRLLPLFDAMLAWGAAYWADPEVQAGPCPV